MSLVEGKASLPFPAPVETSALTVRSWILDTYLGGGRGRAVVEGRSVGASQICSGKNILLLFLNLESIETLALLSAFI